MLLREAACAFMTQTFYAPRARKVSAAGAAQARGGRPRFEPALYRGAQHRDAARRAVAAHVQEDSAVGREHVGLRYRVAAVHQRHRRLAVGPAQTEAELHVAQELPDAPLVRARVLGREADELDAAPLVTFAHLLEVGNLPAARPAPGRPEVDD